MTPPLTPEQQEYFTDALISEIKAEMGRRSLSSRALGRLIGESSQYVSMRLDGGNPRTGKRVALTVRDVAAIASALDAEPFELLKRAQVLAGDSAFQQRIRNHNALVEQGYHPVGSVDEDSVDYRSMLMGRIVPGAVDFSLAAHPVDMEDAEREAQEQEGQM